VGALVILLVVTVIIGIPWYLGWLIACSVVTFLLYGWDKRRAVRQKERVPEVVLHGGALAGGFAGGWLGRWFFHHKTRKAVFLLVLVAATVLHSALIWYLFVR
jgi:uncharacterized membrane protein YsdA (DUF1294 family)